MTDLVASKQAVTETAVTKKFTQTRAPLPTAKPKTPLATNKTDNTGPRPKTWPYKMSEVFELLYFINKGEIPYLYSENLNLSFWFTKFWYLN